MSVESWSAAIFFMLIVCTLDLDISLTPTVDGRNPKQPPDMHETLYINNRDIYQVRIFSINHQQYVIWVICFLFSGCWAFFLPRRWGGLFDYLDRWKGDPWSCESTSVEGLFRWLKILKLRLMEEIPNKKTWDVKKARLRKNRRRNYQPQLVNAGFLPWIWINSIRLCCSIVPGIDILRPVILVINSSPYMAGLQRKDEPFI